MKRYEVKIAYLATATVFVNADSLETATLLLADSDWEGSYGEVAEPGGMMVGDIQEVG